MKDKISNLQQCVDGVNEQSASELQNVCRELDQRNAEINQIREDLTKKENQADVSLSVIGQSCPQSWYLMNVCVRIFHSLVGCILTFLIQGMFCDVLLQIGQS